MSSHRSSFVCSVLEMQNQGGPLESKGGHLRIPVAQASATSHRGWKTQGTPWAREAVAAKTINKFKKCLDGLTEEGTTGEGN